MTPATSLGLPMVHLVDDKDVLRDGLARLLISVRTLEVHRPRGFDKVNVKSAVQLANPLRGEGLDI